MSRNQALEEMDKVDYPPELQEQDKEFVSKKLGITAGEFAEIMALPPKTFYDYPSYKKIFRNKTLLSLYHSLKRS